jgi:hypothetical protein
MPTVGAPEILVFLLVAAALVFLAFRGRVPMFALVLIVVALTPPVAASLAFVVGTVLGSFIPA